MSGMSETPGAGSAPGQGMAPMRRRSDLNEQDKYSKQAEKSAAPFEALGAFESYEYGDEAEADELADAEQAEQSGGAGVLSEAQRRAHTRRLIREFLRAVPRAEPETTLAFLRPDGEARMITRRELSAAIDRLRPRQRQIVRLGIEERWPRQKVCAYLHDISIKTFERDQVEALDLLAQL